MPPRAPSPWDQGAAPVVASPALAYPVVVWPVVVRSSSSRFSSLCSRWWCCVAACGSGPKTNKAAGWVPDGAVESWIALVSVQGISPSGRPTLRGRCERLGIRRRGRVGSTAMHTGFATRRHVEDRVSPVAWCVGVLRCCLHRCAPVCRRHPVAACLPTVVRFTEPASRCHVKRITTSWPRVVMAPSRGLRGGEPRSSNQRVGVLAVGVGSAGHAACEPQVFQVGVGLRFGQRSP